MQISKTNTKNNLSFGLALLFSECGTQHRDHRVLGVRNTKKQSLGIFQSKFSPNANLVKHA